jgi:anti-sigma28 factor (negative regulator of flagellin synthesis)
MTACTRFMAALACFLCVAIALTGEVSAQDKQMYKWTDENGVVHFSEVAPEGLDVQAENLPRDAAPAAASPYPDAGTGPSAGQQRREEIARNSEQARADRANLERQCAAWQAEVERLEPSRNVYQTNAQGETERMDDVVRTNRVAELKDQIAKNCR